MGFMSLGRAHFYSQWRNSVFHKKSLAQYRALNSLSLIKTGDKLPYGWKVERNTSIPELGLSGKGYISNLIFC